MIGNARASGACLENTASLSDEAHPVKDYFLIYGGLFCSY
jgi:hypothetical protein